MPATADTPSPSKKIRALHARMIAEARSRWRGWAVGIAAGEAAPLARDVLEAAAVLGIAAPGERLEADVAVFSEIREAEAGLASCEAAREEALRPWNGSVADLEMAIAAAQAEAERLKAVHGNWADGGPGHHWRTRLHRLRADSPGLFPRYRSEGLA